MDRKFHSQYIPYSSTGKFSKIVLDYVEQGRDLKEFYEHPVNFQGIQSAIAQRKNFNTDRELLVAQFEKQYGNLEDCGKVKANVQALLSENTFTICTAHQPNIFTGHLYFVYKILHVIKIADSLKNKLSEYNFVPVFFMGSEDADLEELNHVVIDGQKYEWETQQTGAVGRMKIDDKLIQLIENISGRLAAEKHGSEIIELLKKCFTKNETIEQATFLFVHALFKSFGLLILLPDNADYKKEMLTIFEDDIFNHASSEIVTKTSEKLAEKYKAQAYPREVNLFYLKDNIRNRIVPFKDHFKVHGTDLIFTREKMKAELTNHPERFSPNVILRGLFQEIILPNIAFVGGGGELAYWLQLKDLFQKNKVPFPLLILRNSFLIIEEKYQELLKKLNISPIDLFKGKENVLNEIVKKESRQVLNLDNEKLQIQVLYEKIKAAANEIDPTLSQHGAALETRQLKALSSLEKKMFRAEKKKFAAQKNQLGKIFSALFPGEGLQERSENFLLFYAKWGCDFMEMIYENSLALEQEFCILSAGKKS